MTPAAAMATGATASAPPARMPAYAGFAALLAMAGLPIYIHAPKFYVDAYGVSLTALGAALFALRLLDFVQDPALGWLASASRRHRGAAAGLATGAMALAMLGLFAVTPPVAPLAWFALTLTVLFSAFSFLTICFYAQGVVTAEAMGRDGHLRLAAWRETGALLGVCLAAVAPTVLALGLESPFAAFAAGFAAVALAAGMAMRAEWRAGAALPGVPLGRILADRTARRLLLLAFLNAAPVAVTSTLFLFFVESRLQLPGLEGPLLLVFFLSAAVAAPFWARLARRTGARPALMAGMALSILAFGFALTLGSGDLWPFVAICAASGAALGADMTLLSAIFARRMARVAPEAGMAFGLWAFATKATLALAAATVLPALDAAGFRPGAEADADALRALSLLYAGVPCVLKFFALALLARTPVEE